MIEVRWKKRFYVSSFDGLRAIGILSIIIYHLYSYRLPGGFLGLDIFLILAGYFMTNRLMTSLMNDGKIPLKQFLLKRLARIALPFNCNARSSVHLYYTVSK